MTRGCMLPIAWCIQHTTYESTHDLNIQEHATHNMRLHVAYCMLCAVCCMMFYIVWFISPHMRYGAMYGLWWYIMQHITCGCMLPTACCVLCAVISCLILCYMLPVLGSIQKVHRSSLSLVVYIYTYTHTHIHTYKPTYIHTHTYTHMLPVLGSIQKVHLGTARGAEDQEISLERNLNIRIWERHDSYERDMTHRRETWLIEERHDS